MATVLICEPASKASAACWTLVLNSAHQSWFSAFWDRIESTLVGALLSTSVAVALLIISRRKERRSLSLDLYKEYFSSDFAKERYGAESFFIRHKGVDWSKTDPYEQAGPEEERVGYAALTRFISRLSILYKERELDRRFTEGLLSRVIGYWWAYVYEAMTNREEMYTRESVIYICDAFRDGSRGREFDIGYQSGRARLTRSVD